MTTWTNASDGSTGWNVNALRYTTWDFGATRWDTDTVETFWDLGISTQFTTATDGTTVWT